ncbi:heme-binding protein [Pseudomonas poae]|uniref:GlcG/HbpS family heme-binding protein n=1 Tax=Pseudomonas poae TaxID=200451 RepID=UPI0030CDB80F
MHQKSYLANDEVDRILKEASSFAKDKAWPVAIAVCDDGGHPLGLVCLDQSAPISAYIALEKARTAALGRRESKAYEDMVNSGRTAFLSAPQLTSLAGGIPIIVDGQVIAAIGVSGVKPEEDISVAQAGSAALSPAKDTRINSTSRSSRD